jgi:hypothetical protein
LLAYVEQLCATLNVSAQGFQFLCFLTSLINVCVEQFQIAYTKAGVARRNRSVKSVRVQFVISYITVRHAVHTATVTGTLSSVARQLGTLQSNR